MMRKRRWEVEGGRCERVARGEAEREIQEPEKQLSHKGGTPGDRNQAKPGSTVTPVYVSTHLILTPTL